MKSVTNVLVAAALVMGIGGAVVAASVADSTEPPKVGDPVILTDTPAPSQTSPQSSASGAPTDSTPPSRTDDPEDDADDRPDQDSDDGPDDDRSSGDGRIDDDDVEEVHPSPRTLGDGGDGDDGDDRTDDGGSDGDDRDDD